MYDTCNWKPLAFYASQLFIGFYYTQQWPNISNAGEKFMISIPKVFLRLLNSFKVIFRQETSTALQRKSQKQINFKTSACLFTFYRWKFFFVYSQQPNIFCFHFNTAEWVGNFVVHSPKASLRIISFRCPCRAPCLKFWSPVGKS